MKNLLIATIAVLSMQSLQAQGIKFGAKAGANMHKISGTSFADEYNLGYYGGFFVEIHASKKLYFMPEVLFNQTSLKTSDEFSDIYNVTAGDVLTIKLNRLSIPVTVNYKLANILSLSAGPVFSINMEQEESFLRNVGQAFTRGDIGLSAGAAIHISKFRLSGRYIAGLKNQNNIDTEDGKSQQIQLGIGLVF